MPRDPNAPNPAAAAMAAMPEERRRILAAMAATTTDPSRYVEAVRDWVANGAASRYVLAPDEVVNTIETAAAHDGARGNELRTGPTPPSDRSTS